MFHDFSRRDMLRMSLASALGVSYSGWLPRLARAAEGQAGTRTGRKACILLWMPGGPSQTDTFDLKPGHANGGPFKEIETAAPGVRFSEHLPLLAKQAKDLAIIRSMTSKEGDHGLDTKLMTTGYRPMAGALDYPSIGSIVAKELSRDDDMLPGYVSVSPFRFGDSGGAGFLGPNYAPLTVTGSSDDPEARANLSIENLSPPAKTTPDAMKSRFEILSFLQNDFQKKADGASTAAHRANAEKAKKMIESQAKHAFKLEEEPAKLRDSYGRNRFGQGCLLARRLIERGVSFVEVGLTGTGQTGFGWDTHADNFTAIKALCSTLDPAWSTLLADLRERGMLQDTLVVWMGEFGRTPRLNANISRDHWPQCYTVLLAGGGIRGGVRYGASDEFGAYPSRDPVRPDDLAATMFWLLGIDPATEIRDHLDRPFSLAGGEPLVGLT
jgi:hypothetical protein